MTVCLRLSRSWGLRSCFFEVGMGWSVFDWRRSARIAEPFLKNQFRGARVDLSSSIVPNPRRFLLGVSVHQFLSFSFTFENVLRFQLCIEKRGVRVHWHLGFLRCRFSVTQ